ncbi:hypothetical protein GCM10009069_29830 [Algimonas arctica]|uniref:Copper-binding protein n=1 Tax=Algimonas arctica TaxID=1479486 RepID=A0A8J3G3W0_9PROT|nr:copper-binding protein [Algimonas arctica]GHB05464.1 hypothetical protein GCM10009069_29830 [Algimonas arctica]
MSMSTRLLAPALLATLLSAPAFAQTTAHSGHDMSQMNHETMMSDRAEHMIEATGIIDRIDMSGRGVSLSHNAIPAIRWPAMTMMFPVGDNVNLNDLQKGQRVQFTLHRAEDGSLPLVELCPTVSETVIAGLCAPRMNHGEPGRHGMKP